ncbi:hypothetical protein [Agrobacterium sp. CG674]
MANRVLLNTEGLKISKPGVDVLTAGPGDLLFQSGLSTTRRLIRGQLNVTVPPPMGFYTSWTATIPLPKTFSSMPLLIMEGKGLCAMGFGICGTEITYAAGSAEWMLYLNPQSRNLLQFHQGMENNYGMFEPEMPDWPYVLNYTVIDWI